MSKYVVISGPYFPVFGLNTEIYEVNLCIESEYRKIRTRDNHVSGHFSRSVRCRSCYQALRENLHLLHPNTIKSYLGTLDTPGNITDCLITMAAVFNKLSGKEKYCKFLVDKTQVKPKVRHQGNLIIDFSYDEATKDARKFLAIMIAPMIGVSAFFTFTIHRRTGQL